MAGIENNISFANGVKLKPSSATDIANMQEISTDISRINYVGNPEGAVSANPSSLCHDPVSGDIYIKQTGMGNTGWVLLSSFQPNSVIQISDDFLTSDNFLGTSNESGSLNWYPFQGVMTFVNGTNTNPGLITGNTAFQSLCFGLAAFRPNETYPLIVGGGQINLNWVLNLSALSIAGSYNAIIGLFDSLSSNLTAGNPTNGIYFTYTDTVNAGNWTLTTTSATVSTTVDSGVAATTDYVNLGLIISADGSSVSFTINGAIVGSAITTNIPTAAIGPAIYIGRGSTLGALIDLFYMKQILTTPR